MQYLTLVPAYGRDYKSIKAVKEAWEDNKDFIIMDISSLYNGSTISKSCAPPDTTFNIRYSKLRKIVAIKPK